MWFCFEIWKMAYENYVLSFVCLYSVTLLRSAAYGVCPSS